MQSLKYYKLTQVEPSSVQETDVSATFNSF